MAITLSIWYLFSKAGVNAGDKQRFTSIPGSRTPAIWNLPKTSNIGIPGQYMFRIDLAKVEKGGCNTGGLRTIVFFLSAKAK